MICRALALGALFGGLGLAVPSGPANPEPAKPSSALELQRDSLKKQRDSVKQQIGVKLESTGSDFEPLTLITPLVQQDCPALPADQVETLILAAAKKQSLPPQLVRAVMRQESAFKPCAVSDKGAQGLMQLMPATAAQLRVADPFDPEQNVQGGAAFLKQLLGRYNGDLRSALVAYNAGATRADQHDATQYPLETQGYLTNIFAELGMPDDSKPENHGSEPAPAPEAAPATQN